MQFRAAQLTGDRPVCPSDPNHIVHAHGSYERAKTPDGTEPIIVLRWICTQCSYTFTVIPDNAIPYRPVSTDLLEKGFESAFSGKDPPSLSENEKGCLKRAIQSFLINIPFLTNTLGQIVETTHPSAAMLWRELRKLGDMKEILLYLAHHFKVSLLKDYRCLKLRLDHLGRGQRGRISARC
jgi:hypothetical protein